MKVLRAVASWFVPTGAALILIAAFLTCLRPILDPDTFMHLATGRLVLAGQLPAVDTFSHTIRGTPWIAHEWLAATLMELVHRAGGMGLLVWATAAVPVLYLLLLDRTCRELGVHSPIARTATLYVAACLTVNLVLARPHMISYLFLALTQYLLVRAWKRRESWPLIPLPVIFWVWANSHGGFILGALPILGVGAELALEARAELPGARARFHRLVLAVGLSVLATTINPHGPGLLLFPFQFGPRLQSEITIEEWRPSTFANARTFWQLIPVLVLVFARWPVPARGELIPAALSLFLAFQAARSVFLVGLFVGPLFARSLARACAGPGWSGRLDAALFGWTARSRPALQVALVMLLILPRTLAGNWVEDGRFPVLAAQLLRESRPPGPIFNNYNFGGYLIWALPEYPVFVDGRAEIYGRTGVLRDYITVVDVLPGWERVLERRGVKLVMERNGHPLTRALANNPGWQQIHRRSDIAVFVRL